MSGKPPSEAVAGIILAGGQSSRMGGGDKCLIELRGMTLLQHVLDRLKPQVASIALSANGDPSRFATYRITVLADTIPGFRGPLAGILAGMLWAQSQGFAWLASAAADTPFFPNDLVNRLADAINGNDIAIARSGERRHPTFALWPTTLAPRLESALEAGRSGMRQFLADYRIGEAEWPVAPIDPFFNINMPADSALAESMIAEHRL